MEAEGRAPLILCFRGRGGFSFVLEFGFARVHAFPSWLPQRLWRGSEPNPSGNGRQVELACWHSKCQPALFERQPCKESASKMTPVTPPTDVTCSVTTVITPPPPPQLTRQWSTPDTS